MNVVFANPWGALALLGVPVVIAIHCLQQKSRILPVSTLFLLENLPPDSRQGRQLTRLRTSLPFWLQILCVLLLTWVLVQPRWLQAGAVQRVVVVLDSSISLRAFTDQLVAKTGPRLESLAKLAPRTFYTLIETDPARPTLYEGFDLAALERKLGEWQPMLPAHDPAHALELARALASRDAVVLFVTDRPHEVPAGVDVFSIGEPLENCGLSGSRLTGAWDELEWQVVVQNDGTQTAHRAWWIELGGRKTDPQTLDLEPGHPQILKGKFPPGLDQLEVCLEPDRFTVDDRMPIVRPQPKKLTVTLLGGDTTADLFSRLAETIPALAISAANVPADVAFLTSKPGAPFTGNAISSVLVYDQGKSNAALVGGPFVAEDDPLNLDLNWQGLVIQPIPGFKPGADDRVLLWKDREPVIYLHPLPGGARQLVFNFNFPASNAERLPAFVLLVSRFVESLRAGKVEPESRNVDLSEPLAIAADPGKGNVVLAGDAGAKTTFPPRAFVKFTAPSLPGFFTLTQGDDVLLTGAAQFSDARESDFSKTAPVDTLAGRRSKLVELQTRAESLTSLWLLLIGVALISYWRLVRPRAS